MVDLTDDILIAYSDGELDEKTAAEVETALQSDPAAREIIEQFQEAHRLAGEAFEAPMDEEIPDRLLKLFEEPQALEEVRDASQDAPSNLADLSQIRAARISKRHTNVTANDSPDRIRRFALPLAASVALILGIGGGFGLSNFVGPDPAPPVIAAGSIPESSLLHAALERSPSLQALEEVSQDGMTRNRIEPLLSFVDRNERYCREYMVTGSTAGGGSQDLTGIACRSDGGTWTQQIAMVREAPADGTYRPASGGGDRLEAFLQDLMKDEPLDEAAEARLLESGWR